MTWSLNEIEGLARKAARGSGLSWGLADEAGKSVRWLVEFDLPGPRLLAELLTQNDKAPYEKLCPAGVQSTWAAPDGALCPLVTGALICDHANRLTDEGEICLGATSYPLLLLPYAAAAATIADTALAVVWGATRVRIGPAGQVSVDDTNTLQTPLVEKVTIRCSEPVTGDLLPRTTRGNMPSEVSRTLGQLAQRIYAPDTAESRLSGAGAGLTDND